MWLLREYHEELEADFGWPYLRRFYRGKITARQFLVRVKHLPMTSATARAINPEGTAWATSDYLLAIVADHLANANWQRAGDSHSKRPTPIKRPSAKAEANKEDIRARAVALRERTQQRAVTGG